MKTLRNYFLGLITLFLSSSTVFAQQVNVQELENHVYSINILGYTSLIVIGEDEVLITDPANTYRANLLKVEISKLTSKPVGKIVLTHEHFDHTGGTEVFKNVEIIAQRNVKAVKDLDPLNMFPDTVDITFNEKMTIAMGTTTVELIHLGAADGVAGVIPYLPNEKIALSSDLYSGQALYPPIYLTDANLLGYRKILNQLVSWNLKHAVNTHSKKTSIKFLKKNAEFYNDLYDLVFPKIQDLYMNNPAGMIDGIIKMSKTLKMPKYKSWKGYKYLPSYIQKMGFDISHGG